MTTEPGPQQADAPPLLNLVQQYGSQRYMRGLDQGANLPGGGERYKAAADALFARIAALVPTLPVQARDIDGDPWFIHGCGVVLSAGMAMHEPGCPDGPWRPLLVADAAPDGDRAPEGWISPEDAETLRAAVDRHGNLLRKVMAALDVEQPEDMLGALELRRAEAGAALLTARNERDEARAELAEIKERRVFRELAEARAEVKRLQAAAAPPYGPDPLAAQPDSLVLRLPEVPEGTVALVGERRWVRGERAPEKWKLSDGSLPHVLAALGSVLDNEPEGVRVELAPPREPRTTAEVWRGLSDADRDQIKYASGVDDASAGLTLHDALDREAEL